MLHHRSKTSAALLALVAGSTGAHRFYLHGARDLGAWAHVLATLLGICGVMILQSEGLGSTAGWIAASCGWIGLIAAFLTAIIYGLHSDQHWDTQFNAQFGQSSASGWSAVLTVIAALLLGAFVLIAGLAFSFEKFFEADGEITHNHSQKK